MIDKAITNFQKDIIRNANAFVYENAKAHVIRGKVAYGRLENRVVMALAVGSTSVIDYVKIPLALIEEVVKGTLLLPTVPFDKKWRHCCVRHYKHACQYLELIPIKLILGTIKDIGALYVSLTKPQRIPYGNPPSYYGWKTASILRNKEEIEHPSIY